MSEFCKSWSSSGSNNEGLWLWVPAFAGTTGEGGEVLQKTRQVIRDMIDMGRAAALQLPVFADHFLAAVGHHQHRGHAEFVRHHEVAGEVLEHRRTRRLDVVEIQK